MSDYFELSREDYDLLMELPHCGCGRPDLVYDVFRTLLRLTKDKAYPRIASITGGVTAFYLASYVLDDIGATEHGGSVEGAWITSKGERLLGILDRYSAVQYEPSPAVTVA